RVLINNVQHPFRALSGFTANILQPENSRRERLSRVMALMGEITHATYQIQIAVPVNIGRRQRMGLRIIAIELTQFPGSPSSGITSLLVPPHAVSMCSRTNDIGIAIAVHIHHIHLGTIQPEIGRMERPIWLPRVCWRFPPALFDDHVAATVAVNVAKTKSV